MRLAILSDLHSGRYARFESLRTDSAPGVADEALEDLRERVLDGSIGCDYLIVPGDMTEAGKPEEYECAGDALSQLQDLFSLPRERLIVVPGNHDCDYDQVPDGYHAFHSNAVFSELAGLGHNSLVSDPFVSAWDSDELLLVAFNSAWEDTSPTASHHGSITLEQIRLLRTMIPARAGGVRAGEGLCSPSSSCRLSAPVAAP